MSAIAKQTAVDIDVLHNSQELISFRAGSEQKLVVLYDVFGE